MSLLYVSKYPRLYIHESIHKSMTEFFNEEECTNLRWSDCEEIPHVQGAEKPQQEGRRWSGWRRYPTLKGLSLWRKRRAKQEEPW